MSKFYVMVSKRGLGGPVIVFPDKEEGMAAAYMIEKVSGERPVLHEASLYERSPAPPKE